MYLEIIIIIFSGSKTYFFDKNTDNVFKVRSTGSTIYLRCDVKDCKASAKWNKNGDIVESYGEEHNHTRQIARNLYRQHCLSFRVGQIANDPRELKKSSSQVYEKALAEFHGISMSTGFRKQMLKKVKNCRQRNPNQTVPVQAEQPSMILIRNSSNSNQREMNHSVSGKKHSATQLGAKRIMPSRRAASKFSKNRI